MNDPAMLTILIAGIVTIIGAIATAMVQVIRALREIHRVVNSRMTELLEATRAMGVAEGREAGRDDQVAASADAAKRTSP